MAGTAKPGGFWNRISDADRTAFENVARPKNFQPGVTLIRAGDAGEWAAVLLKGSVQVVAADEDRKIAVRRAGDIIGEQAPLDGSTRSATVVTETSVQALVIGRRQFDQVLLQRPNTMRVLCAIMSERLRESDQRLTVDSVLAKLIRLIVDLAGERGLAVGGDVQIRIKSQTELAETLDVSRVSVGRALGTLREEGLVSTSRKQLAVHDLDALRERPVS